MPRRIAVYGKGGIGKSTISSNLTAALGEAGVKVMQVGCDPKHDSTRSLIGGSVQSTVLDYLKRTRPEDRRLEDVVAVGYRGCLCVEAGGPEPGVGCAGRGIISAFTLLDELGADALRPDLTLYDVLGDVVCGGFAVPLRNGYADTVYIVTSGEFMSIYAANNILRGTANYDPDRIGGIIFNSRGDPAEEARVDAFSEAIGIPVIARFARSNIFMEAEKKGQTVVQMAPDSPTAAEFRELAEKVREGKRYRAKFLQEDELERLILGRVSAKAASVPVLNVDASARQRLTPYSSRTTDYNKAVQGCAFSGASSVCTSVPGLTVVLHSPRSCAHFTVQMDSNSVRGAYRRGYETAEAYEDPDVVCTDMRESDMIFGGNGRLKGVLEDAAESGKRDIAVITACPPGIIGDDVPGIVRDIEQRYPGTRIAVMQEDGNATGDYLQGVVDAGIGLLKTFRKDGEKIPDSVNLVGAMNMSSAAMSQIRTVTEMLSELGVGVNCVVPGMCGIPDIERTSRGEVNLMLNADKFTQKLCMFMKDEFDIDALAHPVRGGLAGTSEWVHGVAEFFGRKDRADTVMKKIEKRLEALMAQPRKVLAGRTCCVLSFYDDVRWITEAIEGAGMLLQKGYILRRADHTDALDSDAKAQGFVKIGADGLGAAVADVAMIHPDIFLAPAAVDLPPDIYQSRLPYSPESQPYAARWLADDWARGMLAPAEEGWRKDVA